mgnify:CR=1 FL=1|jgi:molybdopterin-synthase adenylyltransferase
MLNEKEKDRYSRQLIFPSWGDRGQEKLKSSTVFIAGVGGLGSPPAAYLAAAGVGTIRLCDSGFLELSNLNRQILYTMDNIDRVKVEAAAENLRLLNDTIDLIPLEEYIDDDTIGPLVGDSDLIIDCMDNFDSRYVLNRLAVKKGIPLIHAGISGLSGQIMLIHSPETPCLSCIFPEVLPGGVLPVIGVTPGVIGSLAAAEALKYLIGMDVSLKGKLLIWDGNLMSFETINLTKNPGCPVCG